MSGNGSASPVELSVVLPVYNEEDNLEPVWSELIPILESTRRSFEVVFVDDGSSDGSPNILRQFAEQDPRVRIVRFARNFGQQMAHTAGLRNARGKVVIIMDADMQTPAENIPAFLARLDDKYDIVYGVREKVAAPLYRRIGTRMTNWLICRITGFEIPDSASGFLALDKRLVERVNRFNDRSRYLSGLFAWLAYGRYSAIEVTRRPRLHGESKYNFRQLAMLVLNFIALFSVRPLYLAFWAAFGFAGLGVVLLVTVIAAAQIGTVAEAGLYAALLAFLAALQLSYLGLVGAYVGRIYGEVRQNPPYVIMDLFQRESAS